MSIFELRILFLHPNFPGQFKFVAQHLAKSHDVAFLCQTHYGRKLKGVNRLCLKGKAGDEYLKKQKLNSKDRTIEQGKQFMIGMEQLKKNCWEPDIIISQSAFGCGLYAKVVFPRAKLISYLEWWFKEESEFLDYDQENSYLSINKDSIKRLWEKNMTMSMEIICADAVLCPTEWQRSQYPELIRDKLQVLPEGVDTKHFRPIQSDKSDPYITYGTRGMEPIRGFDKLIYSIPKILKKWPKLRIEIAGEDGIFYGGKCPDKFSSWGKWAQSYLKEHKIDDRVIWKGRLQGKSYIEWLQNSSCHIYLSHPFVISWSLIEAYCCGIPIVSSDIYGAREICKNTAIYVDHRNFDQIVEGVNASMRSNNLIKKEIRKQRDISRFDYKRHLLAWDALISDLSERKK